MRSRRTIPTGSSSSISADIVRIADELGFNHVALTPLTVRPRDQQSYLAWCNDGFAADMAYLTREPEKRLLPQKTFAPATAALTIAVSYFQGIFPEKPGRAYGRVARYAWGRDYHAVLQARLQKFIERITPVLASSNAVLAVDTKPLLERSLAEQSGLGFVGKNTVLIMPKSPRVQFHVGSWVFLAEILLSGPTGGYDFKIQPSEEPSPAQGCGSCTRCIDKCPTSAFVSPYRLDARRCISYLTIENKGWIDRSLRFSLGDWIFGCDICQEVCPFNARALETKWPEFSPTEGAGAWVSLADILSVDDAAFKLRWGHTPLSRAKRRGLVRNACVVAGNSGDDGLSEYLFPLLEDHEPVIRGHALWALSQFGMNERTKRAAERLLRDVDETVRSEAKICLQDVA